jgi:hypothetical protein
MLQKFNCNNFQIIVLHIKKMCADQVHNMCNVCMYYCMNKLCIGSFVYNRVFSLGNHLHLQYYLNHLEKAFHDCQPCSSQPGTQSESGPQPDTHSGSVNENIPMPIIHTPLSLASTPPSNYSTPEQSEQSETVSTPSSTSQLIQNPPAKSTRSQTKGRVLFALK